MALLRQDWQVHGMLNKKPPPIQKPVDVSTEEAKRQQVKKVWRGYYERYKNSAAEIIQAHWRGYAAQRLKHVRTRGVLRPWLLGTRNYPQHYLAREIAACVIQRWWRGLSTRQRVAWDLDWSRELRGAAIALQCAWRVREAAKMLERLRAIHWHKLRPRPSSSASSRSSSSSSCCTYEPPYQPPPAYVWARPPPHKEEEEKEPVQKMQKKLQPQPSLMRPPAPAPASTPAPAEPPPPPPQLPMNTETHTTGNDEQPPTNETASPSRPQLRPSPSDPQLSANHDPSTPVDHPPSPPDHTKPQSPPTLNSAPPSSLPHKPSAACTPPPADPPTPPPASLHDAQTSTTDTAANRETAPQPPPLITVRSQSDHVTPTPPSAPLHNPPRAPPPWLRFPTGTTHARTQQQAVAASGTHASGSARKLTHTASCPSDVMQLSAERALSGSSSDLQQHDHHHHHHQHHQQRQHQHRPIDTHAWPAPQPSSPPESPLPPPTQHTQHTQHAQHTQHTRRPAAAWQDANPTGQPRSLHSPNQQYQLSPAMPPSPRPPSSARRHSTSNTASNNTNTLPSTSNSTSTSAAATRTLHRGAGAGSGSTSGVRGSLVRSSDRPMSGRGVARSWSVGGGSSGGVSSHASSNCSSSSSGSGSSGCGSSMGGLSSNSGSAVGGRSGAGLSGSMGASGLRPLARRPNSQGQPALSRQSSMPKPLALTRNSSSSSIGSSSAGGLQPLALHPKQPSRPEWSTQQSSPRKPAPLHVRQEQMLQPKKLASKTQPLLPTSAKATAAAAAARGVGAAHAAGEEGEGGYAEVDAFNVIHAQALSVKRGNRLVSG